MAKIKIPFFACCKQAGIFLTLNLLFLENESKLRHSG